MKHRLERREYRQGPITLRTLMVCGFRPKIERYAAEVNAACTVWLKKRELAKLSHPWRQVRS